MGLFDFIRGLFKNSKANPEVEFQSENPEIFIEQVQPFLVDKASWQWDSALESLCEQDSSVDTDELTEEQETLVWAYAGNHMAMFLTWAIMRDFISDFHKDEDADAIAAVKNKSMTGMEFFMDLCDCVLNREDFSDDILGFVDVFYNNHYLRVYSGFWHNVLDKLVLSTAFAWEDYDAFEKILDLAFAEYKSGNLSFNYNFL